jgi:polygalacturonase
MAFKNIKDYANLVTENRGWTEAFQKAVSDIENEMGGTLYVPSGIYETCSILLKDNMKLELEHGAVLKFIDDCQLFEVIETEFEGILGKMYMPCIYAKSSVNVSVTGGGTIDGQGMRWWKDKNQLPYSRPYLICFEDCKNVRLEGVTLINSPSWTVHPVYCDNVLIHGISIKNPADSPNTDGIDPDSSSNVRISNCMIDVGDDCIAIKSGTEDTKNKRPCENITITNCNMIHGHGGVVIGSEMSGTVKNVTVTNCVFQDTDRGIRLKTRRRRGGAMEHLTFQNIVMDRVICPITFNMYYYCGKNGKEKYVWDKEPYPVDESTPAIRDISISNLIVNNAQAAAGFFYGLPEQPIENVTISNSVIRMNPEGPAGNPAMMGNMEPMKAAGFFLRHVKGLVLNQVKISGNITPDIDFDETADYIRN